MKQRMVVSHAAVLERRILGNSRFSTFCGKNTENPNFDYIE